MVTMTTILTTNIHPITTKFITEHWNIGGTGSTIVHRRRTSLKVIIFYVNVVTYNVNKTA